MRRLLLPCLIVVAIAGCTCQRPENIAAKDRLTKPQTKADVSAKAAEKIDVDGLTDPAKMKRAVHMEGAEVAARLGAYVFSSDGLLTFARASTPDAGVRSAEKSRLVQTGEGAFAIDVTTGDGSEMKLAYVNEVFFLKNGNGKWRVSRDPSGERNLYRDDALAVWGSFYDLVAHALVVERTGATTKAGRNVVGYSLKLPDQGSEAATAGREVNDGAPPMVPAPDAGPDAGMVPGEDDDTRRKRIAERVGKWAKRSKPAGGSGTLFVDEATGVVLAVDFEGALVVGDGADPARLTVKLHQQVTDVGVPQTVTAPQDAIDEIVRKKMPAEPRAILEDAKVVPPLPRDAGPGGGGGAGGGGSKQPAAGDLPDDDDDN
ncbi:MAG: hypothetical protein FJ137_13385 [Deltaproteobacteria bacterium]|nr:hypothetical protein [Deltaproteobacteria bacterium]